MFGQTLFGSGPGQVLIRITLVRNANQAVISYWSVLRYYGAPYSNLSGPGIPGSQSPHYLYLISFFFFCYRGSQFSEMQNVKESYVLNLKCVCEKLVQKLLVIVPALNFSPKNLPSKYHSLSMLFKIIVLFIRLIQRKKYNIFTILPYSWRNYGELLFKHSLLYTYWENL